MRVDEAAKATGISVSLLNKLRVYGGGPTYIKLGRAVRYDEADIAAWINGSKRENTAANDNAAATKAA